MPVVEIRDLTLTPPICLSAFPISTVASRLPGSYGAKSAVVPDVSVPSADQA